MRTAADLRRAAFSFRNEGSSVEVADIEGPWSFDGALLRLAPTLPLPASFPLSGGCPGAPRALPFHLPGPLPHCLRPRAVKVSQNGFQKRPRAQVGAPSPPRRCPYLAWCGSSTGRRAAGPTLAFWQYRASYQVRYRGRRLQIEPAPVVPDLQVDLVLPAPQFDSHLPGSPVLLYVGQRLLHNAKEGVLRHGRQALVSESFFVFDPVPFFAEAFDVQRDGGREPEIIEHRRPQGRSYSPSV